MKSFFLAIWMMFLPTIARAQMAVTDTGLPTTGDEIYDTEINIGTFIGMYIIKPAMGILGIVFLLLLIYAGFLWMTAAGNETQLTKAKSILTNSLIGLIIIVTAYAVTDYLVGELGS